LLPVLPLAGLVLAQAQGKGVLLRGLLAGGCLAGGRGLLRWCGGGSVVAAVARRFMLRVARRGSVALGHGKVRRC